MSAPTKSRPRLGGLTPRYVDPDAKQRTQETQVMLEETAFFRSFGMGWDEIARRLGVQLPSLVKALERAREDGLVIE